MQPTGELMNGVSVIICCYNSGWVIARALAALKKQDLSSNFGVEIILVDNNCTDDTVKVAERVMADSAIPFRIVAESKSGLVYAREKGVAEVRYKYIVFCDDDNLLCPQYVQTVYDIFENNPKIGAVGGRGIPEFQVEPDPRILPYLEGYACSSQLTHKDWLFGAGLGLRTDLVRDVYTNQRRFLIGRKGNQLLSGDDSELVHAIVLRGYQSYPTDNISYIHVLKSSRLTWEYFQQMCHGFDLARSALDVMELVLNEGSFNAYVQRYARSLMSLFKYSLYRWHPQSANVRKSRKEEIAKIRYWGIFKLWQIWREWNRIKESVAQ